MGMHVVIVGNPVDGVYIYGPFKTIDDATDWAIEKHGGDQTDWWAVPILSPDSWGE